MTDRPHRPLHVVDKTAPTMEAPRPRLNGAVTLEAMLDLIERETERAMDRHGRTAGAGQYLRFIAEHFANAAHTLEVRARMLDRWAGLNPDHREDR